MAKKLTDDNLRIILDVEAKGVQATLQQIASESFRLADANKQMKDEMKAAEKQMNDAAKTMEKLEKAGKTTSNAYDEAKKTFESAKGEVADYKQKIEQNTKAIADNEKQTKGIIETMKVQDMTMSQLKQRASELQQQLNNTSASLSPEAYKKLQGELTELNERMFVVKKTGKSMLDQFALMNNPIGSAAQSVQGFIQALKALIANPAGWAIMAIVAAFYALKAAIAGSDEASTKFAGVMSALGSVLDSLKRIVTEVVMLLINLAKMDFSAMKENINTIKELGSNLSGNARAAYDAAIAEDALNDAIARNNDITEVNKARIEELRQIVQDSTKSLEERKKASDELLKLENENYKMAVSNISGQYDVWKGKNKNLIDAMKRGNADQFAEVEKYMQMVQEGTELTFEQRKELARLVNDITTTLDKGTEEEKAKFRSFFSELSTMQQDYFAGSRRDQKKAASLETEERQNRAQAAKEALEKRLQDEENHLNEEINKLKQARLQGLLTEKDYNKQVEQLTVDSLNRKINIKGQEKDKILQLEAQILDAQIKQQSEADKELLEELTKTKDNQLALVESARNTRLAQLQEEESDQKIYALRAAEIEAQTAKDREDVIKAFGQTLEQAEFKNNKIRLDAIEKNGKEITDAESKTLNEQANLRKLFAKTTADFERQYNIKTWEQRKEDELLILKKQYDEKLLSEETYQLAVKAIEKKYADEKLKVRQQYSISNLKEQYDAELELLNNTHEKGLLSEEEYQQALLQIKLKYAQEYANKVEEFAKIGSDTVKAFSEAETATLDAEYTKRQSALTEQYNQGIISQEEYNNQKEQLDYEEKKKALDIQKKYADVNFAMQAAEIISSGAVAAINAFKSLAGIPVVGPALGAAAAALVAVTTALRLKQAKAERDRVKAMTLEAPNGGSSSTPRTGEIRLREGLAEGGYNMSDGGYTKQGGKYEVAGYLPVHGGEYVIASDELKQPVIASMARAIETERRKRTGKNAISGLAEGGSNTSSVDSGMITANNEVMLMILKTLNRLEEGDIKVTTNYGITEMEAKQREKMEAESKFTRA